MDKSLYETCLQGITVVVFIKTNILVRDNEYNSVRLIEGIGHWTTSPSFYCNLIYLQEYFLVSRALPPIIVYQRVENDERTNQIHGFPIEHSREAAKAPCTPCSGQFAEYFQRVVVKLKALIAMLDVQTSTRLDSLIYAYGKKLNKK